MQFYATAEINSYWPHANSNEESITESIEPPIGTRQFCSEINQKLVRIIGLKRRREVIHMYFNFFSKNLWDVSAKCQFRT